MRGLPVFSDPNLIVGTEGFSDAGVYRLRDDLLIVQSLDFFPPLVDDPFEFGRIAAANSLSDIYAMGARPVTALNIVGFPDDRLGLDVLAEILRGGSEQVRAAGAVVVGGHTVRDSEIKYGLSATGVVAPADLLTNRGARPGDRLVLTKALGTGAITTAFKAGRCPPESLQCAIRGMTTLNKAASIAAVRFRANAVTDITGFGFAGHACELAEASRVTLRITASLLPVLPGARALIRAGFKTRATATNRAFTAARMGGVEAIDDVDRDLLFDAQTSGGLLISVPEHNADAMLAMIREQEESPAVCVGAVEPCGDAALVVAP